MKNMSCVLLVNIFIYHVFGALPSLPDRFFTIIEANIVNKNKTLVLYEAFDYNASKAKLVMLQDNMVITTYDNFENNANQKWTFMQYDNDYTNVIPGSCKLTQYSNSRDPFRAQSRDGGLVSSSQWFQFGEEFGETELPGNYVIRDIPANAFIRTVSSSRPGYGVIVNVTFDAIYYFNDPSWSFYDFNNGDQYPLRLTINGTHTALNLTDQSVTSYEFEHIYEFVSFRSGEHAFTSDELEFIPGNWYSDCDVSAYCTGNYTSSDICKDARGPSIPKLPNQYSTWFEMTITTKDNFYFNADPDTTFYGESYYDYPNNRIHNILYFDELARHQIDFVDMGQSWTWNAHEHLFIIHDEESYEADGEDHDDDNHNNESENEVTDCELNEIKVTDGYDTFVKLENAHIVNPWPWFQFNDSNRHREHSQELWLGYDDVRGIVAEKWVSIWNESIEQEFYGQKFLSEYIGNVYHYFSSENWSLVHQLSSPVVPLRTEMTGIYRVYNYTNGQYTQWGNDADINIQVEIFGFEPALTEDLFDPPYGWRSQCNISNDYCTNYPNTEACFEPKTLPSLPSKWKAIVEINQIMRNVDTNATSNQTFVINEWFDTVNQKAKRSGAYNGVIYSLYEDLNIDQFWIVQHKLEDVTKTGLLQCDLEPYSERSIKAGLSDLNEYGHFKSTNDLLFFGDEYNETYIKDDFIIRGIKAHGWERTFNFEAEGQIFNMTIQYYFSNVGWTFNGLPEQEIPLMIEATGTYNDGMNTYEVSIESHFIHFEYGDNSFNSKDVEFIYDDWYSECDVSKYCTKYSSNIICSEARGPAIPSLPYNVETSFELKSDNSITYYDMYYDYYGNRAHIVYHGSGDYVNNAIHQLELFETAQKWMWIGDAEPLYEIEHQGEIHYRHEHGYTNCRLTKADLFTSRDFYVPEYNGHVAPPVKWFQFNDIERNRTAIWAGYDTVRGIPAEKWMINIVDVSEFNSTFVSNYDVKVYSDYVEYVYFNIPQHNMLTSNWDDVIPLRYHIKGSYDIYNYTPNDNNYTTFWQSGTVDQVYDITKFVVGVPDEKYFTPPYHFQEDCDIDTNYCQEYPNSLPCGGGVPFPSFPDKFVTHVEATFTTTNYTFNVLEAFDESQLRHRVDFYPTNSRQSKAWGASDINNTYSQTHLQIDETLWSFDEIGGCKLEYLSSLQGTFISKLFDWNAGIASVKTIYNTHEKNDIKYIGNTVVRLIPVTQWDLEVTNNFTQNGVLYEMNAIATYYFMTTSYNTLYPNYNIPVRIVLRGTSTIKDIASSVIINTHNIENFYDFVNFIPGKPDDKYFKIPSDRLCGMGNYCDNPKHPELLSDNVDLFSDYYTHLLSLCNNADNYGIGVTSCYGTTSCDNTYESSRFISECQSALPHTINNCNVKHKVTGLQWFLFFLMFIIGLFISALYHYRKNKAKVLEPERVSDGPNFENPNATTAGNDTQMTTINDDDKPALPTNDADADQPATQEGDKLATKADEDML